MGIQDRSLYEKIKIKKIIDSLFLLLGMLLIIAVFLFVNNLKYQIAFIITIFVVLDLFQIYLTKEFLFKSFSLQLSNDLQTRHVMVKDIEESIQKQKDLVSRYSILINNLKAFFTTLKDASGKTKVTAQKVVDKTHQSIMFTDKEQETISNSLDKMHILKQKIQIIAELILELSEHIQQISATTDIVKNITEQTNMLALNAAVEAARAGEHGKGFAVVAGEIRKLADESKHATSKIILLINNIQQVANSTVMATEEGTLEIDTGVRCVQSILTVTDSLKLCIEDILTSVENIMLQSDNQNHSTAEIDLIIKHFEDNLYTAQDVIAKNLDQVKNLNKMSNSIESNIFEKLSSL